MVKYHVPSSEVEQAAVAAAQSATSSRVKAVFFDWKKAQDKKTYFFILPAWTGTGPYAGHYFRKTYMHFNLPSSRSNFRRCWKTWELENPQLVGKCPICLALDAVQSQLSDEQYRRARAGMKVAVNAVVTHQAGLNANGAVVGQPVAYSTIDAHSETHPYVLELPKSVWNELVIAAASPSCSNPGIWDPENAVPISVRRYTDPTNGMITYDFAFSGSDDAEKGFVPNRRPIADSPEKIQRYLDNMYSLEDSFPYVENWLQEDYEIAEAIRNSVGRSQVTVESTVGGATRLASPSGPPPPPQQSSGPPPPPPISGPPPPAQQSSGPPPASPPAVPQKPSGAQSLPSPPSPPTPPPPPPPPSANTEVVPEGEVPFDSDPMKNRVFSVSLSSWEELSSSPGEPPECYQQYYSMKQGVNSALCTEACSMHSLCLVSSPNPEVQVPS